MNEESISVPVFAQWANNSINFIVGSWKKTIQWSVSHSVKNVNEMCFMRYLD